MKGRMDLPFFKKSFVSLFFTPRKLQVLQLNSKKNTVEKFIGVDLPEGLIVKYKVEDKKAMVTILQDIWKRLGLKEKSVGIVIPEFSTFTKSLILPPLKTGELDEAVRWHFQDFWPSEDGPMMMDWKIVQKPAGNCQILSVAIPKDLLLSFVDAVSEAGLFPLVVETPSLSLVRVSDKDPSGKLVIYANFGEAVLALAKGEEILGSSVLRSSEENNILWTAEHIVKHYSNIEVKRIEIGGLELTQRLVDGLQKNLGRPVHWIESSITGLSAQELQEYLIPLSLQLKDPAEPRDETTVNLLPSRWVKHYQDKRMRLQIWGLLLAASVIIWSCFLITLGVYLMLLRQIKVFQKENAVQAAAIPKEITTQVSEINKMTDKVIKITSVAKTPQEIVKAIIKAKPAGVTLSEYQIALDTGKIFLKGKAADRQALLEFKKALEANEEFLKVQIPISTFETEKNLEFEIRLLYGSVSSKKPIKIPIK